MVNIFLNLPSSVVPAPNQRERLAHILLTLDRKSLDSLQSSFRRELVSTRRVRELPFVDEILNIAHSLLHALTAQSLSRQVHAPQHQKVRRRRVLDGYGCAGSIVRTSGPSTFGPPSYHPPSYPL